MRLILSRSDRLCSEVAGKLWYTLACFLYSEMNGAVERVKKKEKKEKNSMG